LSWDDDYWFRRRRIRFPPFWDDFFEEEMMREEFSSRFPNGFRTNHRHGLPSALEETFVDVPKYEQEVRVIAWLPGVNEKEVRLHATPHTLTIMTEVRGGKHNKELRLPAEVDPKHVKTSYKNRVLEVELKRSWARDGKVWLSSLKFLPFHERMVTPTIRKEKGRTSMKTLTIQIQNVVASVAFNQTFDLNAIYNAFPETTEFKERFPGLIFKLEKPKTTMLIFRTGKMICTGGKSEREARGAIQTVVRDLRKEGIKVAEKPKIDITNMVASAILGGFIDLDRLYSLKRRAKIIFEPEQFPGLIYRWESPKVVFLVFSTGKIVCVGAKKTKDIYEAVGKLQRSLEESDLLIKS
jgi:transcription initiation factor TFIID TATA-box-binding protein